MTMGQVVALCRAHLTDDECLAVADAFIHNQNYMIWLLSERDADEVLGPPAFARHVLQCAKRALKQVVL